MQKTRFGFGLSISEVLFFKKVYQSGFHVILASMLIVSF